MIKATLQGSKEILANLDRISASLPKKATTAYNVAVLAGVEFSKKITPYKTGYLRSRTRPEIAKVVGQVIIAGFYNDCEYGPFVCFGTRFMKARDFMTPAYSYTVMKLWQELQKITL